MAATYQSDVCASTRPPVTPDGADDLVAVRGVVTVLDTLSINETLQMVPLPEGCVPVDCILDCDDLDSSTGIVLSVGVLTSALSNLESSMDLITHTTVAQAGGIARMDQKTGPRIAADQTTLRYIGVKVTTAATGTKAGGTVGLTLMYRAA
jgi:hypothetical protein